MPRFEIETDYYTIDDIADRFGLVFCGYDDIYTDADNAVYIDDIEEYATSDSAYYHCYHCPECGRYFSDSYYWNDAAEMCSDCAANLSEYVKPYHFHKHEFVTFGARREIGFELEVDDGDDREAAAAAVADILGGRVVFEEDGSLSYDGFEIISQPHSIEEMRGQYANIELALAALVNAGYRSHDSGNCGLHVHLSRELFGGSHFEQSTNIEKLSRFFYDNDGALEKLSRRTRRSYCERDERGHYGALNTSNGSTIEIRIARGTLNFATFRAWLEFCIYLTERATSDKTDGTTAWNEWIKLDELDAGTREYIEKRLAGATFGECE